MGRQSECPIFDAEGRDFAEVSAVTGEEHGVVGEGDSGDLQVHCADAAARHPQTLELLYGARICSS